MVHHYSSIYDSVIGSVGAYVPVTMEGNIIVDGILASCYTSAHHDLAHIGMALVRWFPEKMEWIFGDDNGIQGYVRIAEDING